MDRCDVLIVGGGPAGSSCAWRLVQAGLDVVVLDKASFPRDKVCAGWITPAVVRALELDLEKYSQGRTLQPFTGFRTGPLHREPRTTDFGRTISYGIRRCEFDDYLLARSRARLFTGCTPTDLEQDGEGWVVKTSGVVSPDSGNDTRGLHASVLVGAGGHFCPVARRLNAREQPEDVVVAQEIEFRLDPDASAACRVQGDCPELFFWSDLLGYGWCVRKGEYLNVGAGRLSRLSFPAAVREFAAMLEQRGLSATAVPASWKGHAYLLNCTSARRLYADRVLLVGDAAGLALAPSGEGILAAVESGVIAAETILASAPGYSSEAVAHYGRRIEARFGRRGQTRALTDIPSWLRAAAARVLLGSRWLTKRVLLEDAFLHVRRV
ncbi:MAG TPA: NAD(P)/FAD-dependent oxidoreductase [Vicinamibacterales bacterium]|nr:NAD(P)/FAD-dependent oxidoreductase [Vicinamibacterales bacterium]